MRSLSTLLCASISQIIPHAAEITTYVILFELSTMIRAMRIFTFLVYLVHLVQGYNSSDVEELRYRLFRGYHRLVRPIVNQSEPIQVNTSLIIRNIISFDMTNGYLETVGYMTIVWRDEHLSWTNTKFAAIPRLSVGDEIWTPNIIQIYSDNEDDVHSSLAVLSDGTVIQFVSGKFNTFCELNMRFYPRDNHMCKFEFVSASYPAQDVQVRPSLPGADTSVMLPHGEWAVTHSDAVQMHVNVILNFSASQVVYILRLGRLPQFAMLHSTVPFFVLCFGGVFMHVVPIDSGERVSYAVTILLAFIFWQSLMADELPKNSSKLSIFSLTLAFCQAMSGIFTVFSVFLTRMSSLSKDKPIPAFLQSLVYKLFRSNPSFEEVNMTEEIPLDQRNMEDASRANCVRRSEEKIGNAKVRPEVRIVTWVEAAHALDFLTLGVHITLSAIAILAYSIIFLL